ncbi:hypothetical protein DPMN_149089 [Dreissena polymorpha]|uniref:Uncharacterized protein n=1 Tax=Dreissena polymorpha TaxID=45954 RepID=A0A9D4FAS1_DREPO|nr:hypothetical protein DPMN_149089 [Dreissena polymorpha]
MASVRYVEDTFGANDYDVCHSTIYILRQEIMSMCTYTSTYAGYLARILLLSSDVELNPDPVTDVLTDNMENILSAIHTRNDEIRQVRSEVHSVKTEIIGLKAEISIIRSKVNRVEEAQNKSDNRLGKLEERVGDISEMSDVLHIDLQALSINDECN